MDVPTYFRCCFEGASMVKFNKNGKIEWEDGYSPSDESTLYIDNLIQTRDHGYFFSTSQYEHMGRSIIYFHKYSMDGHVEWASGGEVISSEYYSRLAEEDSGFVSYCYNAEFYGDKYNFQVERFNKAGVELSRKTIDTISTSPDHWNWGIPQAVKSLGSRGYLLLCSQYYDNAKDSGIFPTLCRTDTAENIIWQKYFPEVDSGVLTSMEVLQNGNYALFGYGKNNGIKNYYLLVTDSLGNTLNVQNSLSAQTGKLYPDPANDILHFDLGEIPSSSASIITISDLSGKILMQQNTSFKNSVADVSKLPDGVYIFQYRNPEKSWMGKFIISR